MLDQRIYACRPLWVNGGLYGRRGAHLFLSRLPWPRGCFGYYRLAVLLQRPPAEHLRDHVSGYWGYEEVTPGPMRRHEGPGCAVAVVLSFGNDWLVDGERRESFIGGLRTSQVTTEHAGRSCGMQIDLVPWAAHRLLGIPMYELAETTVPLEELLPAQLVERLERAPTWKARFVLLDAFFVRRFADARHVSPEVVWGWRRLRDTHGQVRFAALNQELGWSRKRLVARFREQLGLPPKAVGRLLRFEHARRLAGTMSWGELAFTCGFADQPHLISEFRAFTGRTPETFLQDTAAEAA
jgi:AraC-like DNA-binding protein